jgi:hypothetical protein
MVHPFLVPNDEKLDGFLFVKVSYPESHSKSWRSILLLGIEVLHFCGALL